MLSAVIITLNEQRNIERCVKSLYGIADEILIVDSFSTDNTMTICNNLKSTCDSAEINCVQKEWLGYAKQKNFANSLAKHDWILSLDADEQLSSELQQSITKLKQTENSPQRLYSMNRCTNYCGKWIRHCGWYPDTKIRLFNRHNAIWDDSIIHEKLTSKPPQTVMHLHGDILHYSYYCVKDHILQLDKFTDLTAQQAFDNTGTPALWRQKLKLFFNPKWKFLQSFIFKRGFMDGYHGYLVCKISAFATFLKYVKLLQLHSDDGEFDN